MNHSLIGIIPAAGLGTRMLPYRGLKELFPVGYRKRENASGDKTIVPKVIAEYTIDNMVAAQSKRIIFVLSEQKWELFRFFGNGQSHGADFAYLCQDMSSGPRGMPVALDTAYAWLMGHIVLMGMPDTIIEPTCCFVKLLELFQKKNADLVLGVFPTKHPSSLAPVVIDRSSSHVMQIFDKPETTDIFNTWNIAVWSDSFTELLHQYVELHRCGIEPMKGELLLSAVFNQAISAGLSVHAEFFANGKCHDIASTEKLILTRNQIDSHSLSYLGITPDEEMDIGVPSEQITRALDK